MSKAETIKALKRVPLLSTLSQRELRLVADLTGTRTYAAKENVIKEGDAGDEMFIIETGTASVTRGRRKVTVLGPGDHFGEMSLITKGRRMATVSADSQLTVRVLGRWSLAALLETVPAINGKLMEAMAQRIKQLDPGGVD